MRADVFASISRKTLPSRRGLRSAAEMMKHSKTQSDEVTQIRCKIVSESETARLRSLLEVFASTLDRVRQEFRSQNGGADPVSAEVRLEQVEQLAEKYVAAIQLRLRGFSIDKIDAALDIRSASGWCSGRIPRLVLNLDPQFRRHLEKPISLPSDPSGELAFILGVFCGKSGVTGHYRGFSIHSREPALVKQLASHFKKVFSAAGTVRKEVHGGVQYHHLWVGSNRLGRYFEQVTQRNRVVPLRELPDSHCRQAFLRGFFAACGSAIRVQRRRIHVVKSENRSILDGVAVILKREGVLATVNGQHRAELLIQDQNELDRFRELRILSSASDVSELEAICARRPGRRMFTMEEYRTAVAIADANASLNPGELSKLISEQTSGSVVIDKSVIRQWKRSARPHCQRRLEKIHRIETSLRATPVARKLLGEYLQRCQTLHEPSKVQPLLREIAWLEGHEERDFPLNVSTLEAYRALFEKLKLPFTPAHDQGWHQRGEIMEQITAIAQIEAQISSTRSPKAVLELLRRRMKLARQDIATVPCGLPTLRRYRDLFDCQNLPFGEVHECGWNEAIDAAYPAPQASSIARGVHNLIRRQWDSSDAWLGGMTAISGVRCWRTFDSVNEGRCVLQQDLIELLSTLGLTQAAPAMAWLVGLNIAAELKVISHLVSTKRQVREALYSLVKLKNRPTANASSDAAKVQIYRLLPGINFCLLHQNAEMVAKYLDQPFQGIHPVRVDEDTVLEWLDYIPKYRSRLGLLTEVARKAQQAGLDPRWAVERTVAARAKW